MPSITTFASKGYQKKKKKEQRIENLFEEIMTKNFTNLLEKNDTQVQEVHSPKKIKPKRPTEKHIPIKTSTVKNKENSTGSN